MHANELGEPKDGFHVLACISQRWHDLRSLRTVAAVEASGSLGDGWAARVVYERAAEVGLPPRDAEVWGADLVPALEAAAVPAAVWCTYILISQDISEDQVGKGMTLQGGFRRDRRCSGGGS